MQEAPSNKYLKDLEEAISEDAYSLIKIFEACKKAIEALNEANISPETKFMASKRMAKFVQDVYGAIPNQYRAKVQEIVQEAMFPKEFAEEKAKLEALEKQLGIEVPQDDLGQNNGPEASPAESAGDVAQEVPVVAANPE